MIREKPEWDEQVRRAVRKHGGRLTRSDADDLAQDCHLAMVRERSYIKEVMEKDGETGASKIVSTIAKNVVLNRIRDTQFHRSCEELTEAVMSRVCNSDVADADRRHDFALVLRLLEPKEQELILDLYVNDLKLRDVAKKTGLSTKAVFNEHHAILKKLRVMLGVE